MLSRLVDTQFDTNPNASGLTTGAVGLAMDERADSRKWSSTPRSTQSPEPHVTLLPLNSARLATDMSCYSNASRAADMSRGLNLWRKKDPSCRMSH